MRDSEVLTMEVVGEFLGIDTDSNIFTHFCRYYSDWFPGLRQITRTTFTRQADHLPDIEGAEEVLEGVAG